MRNLEKVTSIHGTYYCVTDDLITQHLKKFGAHQRNELSMLLDCVCVGDTVIDVGANIGTFSVPMARKVGDTGVVVSFEADDDIYEILNRNIVLNKLSSNIQAINAIVSSQKKLFGKVKVDGNIGATSFRVLENDKDNYQNTLSIDEWYPDSGIKDRNIDVIKIDVEGMDADVLFSCDTIIKDHKPVIYIEVSQEHLLRNGYSIEKLESYLVDRGYSFFRNIGARNSNNDNYRLVKLKHIGAGGGFFDLLAIHSDSDRFPEKYDHENYIYFWKLTQIPKKIYRTLRNLL